MWQYAAVSGLSMVSSLMSYSAQSQQAKAAQAWQDYQNKMVNLSNAVNQNAINTNETLSNEAFANQAFNLQRGGLVSEAHAEVSAAAAGVKGRSVNDAIVDAQRTTAQQEYQRQQAFVNAGLSFDQQRIQSTQSAAMNQDYSYIPQPSLGASLFSGITKGVTSSAGQAFFSGAGQSGGSGGSGNFNWDASKNGGMTLDDYNKAWDDTNWN